MRPFHLLVAVLSLGGTTAAVSATHAAAFDPVRLVGSMGRPGKATSAPCEYLLATSPRPCTRTLIEAVRGNGAIASADLFGDTALDLAAAGVIDDKPDTAAPSQLRFEVSQDIYRIHGGPAQLASSAAARSASLEKVLDLGSDD